jgi:hypothetical protein
VVLHDKAFRTGELVFLRRKNYHLEVLGDYLVTEDSFAVLRVVDVRRTRDFFGDTLLDSLERLCVVV